MKNVLFIAMEFAPYQTTGAFRSIYFVKYLRLFGIDPIVITVQPEKDFMPFNSSLNNELLDIVPAETIIYRPKYTSPKKKQNSIFDKVRMYFKINDRSRTNWQKGLFSELPKIINNHNPIAIYVSCPPFSSGRLGKEISKKYNIPLILDMRDGWSHWCISPFATYFHYFFTYLSEKSAFSKASAVVTVTNELKNIFINSHPNLSPNKFHYVPNGFEEQLVFDQELSFKGLNNGAKAINIAYIGNYYYNPIARSDMFTPWHKKRLHKKLQYSPVKEDWLYRSPYFYLKTLQQLFIKHPSFKSLITFTHIGKVPDWLPEMVAEFDLKDNVKFTGFLNYQQMKSEIENVDFFLSTSVKVHNGEDYAIGSKTFDYLAQKKIILGFVTNGSQQNFIERSNTGIILNPDNIKDNSLSLAQVFNNGITLKPNEEYINQFHRKNTAKKMSDIIKKVKPN